MCSTVTPCRAAAASRSSETVRAQRRLHLGDSYTIGEGVAALDNWPQQLAARDRLAGIPVAPPRIIAQTGWTTDELCAALRVADLAPPYDAVSLSIGVNNQYRGRDVAEFRSEFADLLQQAIGLAGHDARRVVVLSIPDWSATPFAAQCDRDLLQTRAALRQFNAAARAVCRRHHITWVAVTDLSRAMATKPHLVSADGLHPSAQEYRRWVRRIARVWPR